MLCVMCYIYYVIYIYIYINLSFIYIYILCYICYIYIYICIFRDVTCSNIVMSDLSFGDVLYVYTSSEETDTYTANHPLIPS